MDIFNRKKVKMLEEQIHDLKMIELENDRLRRALDEVCAELRETVKLVDEMPDDCVPGPYCTACGFGKQYSTSVYVPGAKLNRCYRDEVVGIMCIKANACKNFIQKEN